jgi:hypothetical protein
MKLALEAWYETWKAVGPHVSNRRGVAVALEKVANDPSRSLAGRLRSRTFDLDYCPTKVTHDNSSFSRGPFVNPWLY